MLRHPLSKTITGLLTAATLAAAADELPPKEAPPYTAVYHNSSRSKVNPSDDWTFSNEDTVTISVRTKQSRWENKSDGHVTIIDAPSRQMTTFGGKVPPKTALRTRSSVVAIGWEFGIGTVAGTTENPPEILGTSTIAGHECTRLRFTSEQYGKPEFCVTKTGIVLRFANASSTAESVYEAQSVDETAPEQAKFSVPEGYTIEQRRSTPKNVKIF
jgi:hypothetical protein